MTKKNLCSERGPTHFGPMTVDGTWEIFFFPRAPLVGKVWTVTLHRHKFCPHFGIGSNERGGNDFS
jgi:hypothetical protein